MPMSLCFSLSLSVSEICVSRSHLLSLRLFRGSSLFLCRVLSHCFGCWIKSHPDGRRVKSHVLAHCFGCRVMDVGLNPTLFPTVECWVKSRPSGRWVKSHVLSHICIYLYIYNCFIAQSNEPFSAAILAQDILADLCCSLLEASHYHGTASI